MPIRRKAKAGACVVHGDWCKLGGGSDYDGGESCRRKGAERFLTMAERRMMAEAPVGADRETQQDSELVAIIAEARERFLSEHPEWKPPLTRERAAEIEAEVTARYPKAVTPAQQYALADIVMGALVKATLNTPEALAERARLRAEYEEERAEHERERQEWLATYRAKKAAGRTSGYDMPITPPVKPAEEPVVPLPPRRRRLRSNIRIEYYNLG